MSLFNEQLPYAFRTFEPFPRWPHGTSSAEWSETLALELGDRVAEYDFAEAMFQAVYTYPVVVA